MPVSQYNQPSGAQQYNNQQAYSLIKQKAISRIMSIYNNTIYPVSQPYINVTPQSVGLIKRFYIEVTATLTNTSDANTATLTDFGLANLISNVRFYDTNQLLRHDTNGIHLVAVSSAKRSHPFAATSDWNQTGASGQNRSQIFNTPPASWGVLQGPATIDESSSGVLQCIFEVPIMYSDQDPRGLLFAQSVNATMNLYIEFNQNAFVDTTTTPTADDTFAVYGGAAGTFTSAVVNVYQDFFDQLPRATSGGANAPYILPSAALSSAYMMTRTTYSPLTPNQEYYVPYQNFRLYMSRLLIYNDNGEPSGRKYGTDVQYIREIAANFAPYWQFDPLFSAFKTREVLCADLPAGTYYISHRRKPVYTTQTGNRNTGFYPTTAATGNYLLDMLEYIGNQNVLLGAASATQ